MTVIAMSGNDVFILNGRNFTGFAAGKVTELTLPNNIADLKTGKNGNAIYGLNQSGRVAEIKLVLVRGCADDIYMNAELSQQNLNFAGFTLMYAQYIKKIGDGAGNITSDTYNLNGGIFIKSVPAQTDTEGTPEQSSSEYMLRFANNPRTIAS